jgi:LemA protein
VITPLSIAIGVLVLAGLVAAAVFNQIVRLRNRFRNAWSQIDVQLKRRHDLIPNLVEAAKGYLKHEQGTLEAVTQARSAAVSATAAAATKPGDPALVGALGGAESHLVGALGRLLMIAESYPELKGNQSISDLMEALTTTENRVAFARQHYNDAVMHYNTARETFPSNLIAALGGFKAAALFQIDQPGERQAPAVSFS